MAGAELLAAPAADSRSKPFPQGRRQREGDSAKAAPEDIDIEERAAANMSTRRRQRATRKK